MATGLQIPQMGNSRTPSWTGMLPQVSRGMNPGEIAEMQYREQQTRGDQAEYQEYLRDQENRALERDIKRQQLEFQQGKAGEQMQQQYAQQKMDFDAASRERLADEFTSAESDPEAYAATWNKYHDMLAREDFPKQLMTQDGSMLPHEQARPAIRELRDAEVNNVAQQKALDLANLKGFWQQQNSQGLTATSDSPKQWSSSRDRVVNFAEENNIDLGSLQDTGSNLRYLISLASNVPNAVARMQAKRTGQGVSEEEVRGQILKIAQEYIHEQPGWWDFIKQGKRPQGSVFKTTEIDKEALEERISSHFGLARTTITEFRNDPDVSASFSGPSKIVKEQAGLPGDVVSKLKEGVNTTFNNGQVWTKQNGQPKRVQ